MIYQPMVEPLAYLRSNGFKTYIASGGGVEFRRGWTDRVHGVLPEQVIGSAGTIGILNRIGRRPIAAFGNSDGDLQMLQWTMAGRGARFALFVHHDDAARDEVAAGVTAGRCQATVFRGRSEVPALQILGITVFGQKLSRHRSKNGAAVDRKLPLSRQPSRVIRVDLCVSSSARSEDDAIRRLDGVLCPSFVARFRTTA
jgi:hypothetical protein